VEGNRICKQALAERRLRGGLIQELVKTLSALRVDRVGVPVGDRRHTSVDRAVRVSLDDRVPNVFESPLKGGHVSFALDALEISGIQLRNSAD
jgi:hypothetical protein